MSGSYTRAAAGACAVCGAPFEQRPYGKPKVYCGRGCKVAAAVERKRNAYVPKPLVPCSNCGQMVRRGSGRRSWCSKPECVRERNRRNSAVSYARNRDAHRKAVRDYYHRVGSAQWDRYRTTRRLDAGQRRYTTPALVKMRFAYFGERCWRCGAADVKLERDHVKPLSRGGLHLPANIRPICGFCNRSKGNRWPVPTAPATHQPDIP